MANLLVVDDDNLSRQILTDLLQDHGHAVVACSDAAAAREVLTRRTGWAHAVITDVRMPGMDGIDLARLIRTQSPELPVALMSAEPDFNIYEEAAQRGLRVTVMLQKPFQTSSVLRVLRQLVGEGKPTRVEAVRPPPAPAIPLGSDDLPAWLTQPPLPAERLSPVRLWFVAARRKATGHIVVKQPRAEVRVGLRAGELVTGPGAPSGPVPLARWLMELHVAEVGFVPCDAWQVEGPVGRQLPVPEAVSQTLATVPHSTIQLSWKAVLSARALARTPTDSRPEAWGLDRLAALVHGSAKGQVVESLVQTLSQQSPAFSTSGFRTLEMLTRLNLISLLA